MPHDLLNFCVQMHSLGIDQNGDLVPKCWDRACISESSQVIPVVLFRDVTLSSKNPGANYPIHTNSKIKISIQIYNDSGQSQ